MWTIWCNEFAGWLRRTWFRWFQICQNVTAKRSRWWLFWISQDKISLKSMNWTAPRTLHSCKSDHTGSNSGQDHKACKEFSDEAWHLTQCGSVDMVRRNRALFVGIASRQARHSSVFTFDGARVDRTVFHTWVWSFVVTCGSLLSSSSIFKNLYPVLQLYLPSLECGQNKTSSFASRLKGIVLISFASSALNRPSIISKFHCLLLGSIRTSTVELSRPMDRMTHMGDASLAANDPTKFLFFSHHPLSN